MGDDGGTRARALGALLVAATLAGAASSEAQVSARLQVQYQRVEQDAPRPGGGVTTRTASEFWLQTYEVNHALRLDRATTVASQFRFTDLSYVGRPDANRTPYGSLRLANPNFGFSAGHRPSVTTVTIEEPARTREVTSRLQETFFNGYLSLASGTRIDGLWSRRHRNPDTTSLEKTGLNRTLRASQSLGPLSLRGGFAEVLADPGGTDPRATQRSWDGGANLAFAPHGNARVEMDYGYSRSDRLALGRPHDRGSSHTASANTTLRQSDRVDWSAHYTYRAAATTSFRNFRDDLHDGAAQVAYRPNRLLQLVGAGGARTASIAGRTGLLRYASALASLGGSLRPGWTGQVSASETVNWDATAHAFRTESLYGVSSWRLRQGLDLRGDLQVASNGDSAARDARISTQGGLTVSVSPLRSLTFSYGERRYQTGPRIGESRARSRSHVIDLRWRPVPAVEVTGSRSVTGAFPDNDPQLSTTTWLVRLRPSAGLQAWASLTRSDQDTRGAAAVEGLSGREIATARLVATVARDVTLIGGVSVANRGRDNEGRQYDVSITRRFGR